jgi:hypothetical protein
LRPDGVTVVAGATVNFSASPAALLFSECSATACTLTSDAQGDAVVHLLLTAPGAITITASLANGNLVRTTVLGTRAALDLALFGQTTYMGRGATTALALTSRVLANGSPVASRSVSYQITSGAATLTAAAALTNSNGYAVSTLNITNLANEIDVKACIAPERTICRDYSVFVLPASDLSVDVVSGAQQIVSAGQSFAPLQLRVTDSATHTRGVAGAAVLLRGTVTRWRRPPAYIPDRPTPPPSEPIVLQSWETMAYSNTEGLVTFAPTADPAYGAVDVSVLALAGDTGFAQFQLTRLGDAAASPSNITAPYSRRYRRSLELWSTRPPIR